MNEYTEKDVDALVERVQILVDQYNSLNLTVTKEKAEVAGRQESLVHELKTLAGRIPEKLSEEMMRVSMTLERLCKDVEQVGIDIKADYVRQADFAVLKVEHDQIKRLMWGFIAMVLTAFVGGVLAFFFKG